MKHRMIVLFTRTGVISILLASGFLAGCSDSEDLGMITDSAPQSEAPRTQLAPTHDPKEEASDFTPMSCTGDAETNKLIQVDGEFKCMTQDESKDYDRHLWERAYATLEPLRMSYEEGASSEVTMRALVALSCKQTLENPHYWSEATDLYYDILGLSDPEELASEWPNELTVAMKQGCFE